nr:MAG: replication initiation protein [Microvirus Sku218]
MCDKSTYKFKLKNGQYSKDSYSIDKLYRQFDMSTIKRFLKRKQVIILPCGKCDLCREMKKANYKNKVQAQLKVNRYSYLITLTLDNKTQLSLLNSKEREYCLANQERVNYSQFTTLSKIAIDNIIRNWKLKINRHYGYKVSTHYFLCGEYGSNTHRAHYHVLLMLDVPLPNLVKQTVMGNHYKSSIIDSKQYGIYDIQPTNNNLASCSYISKYLSKSSSNDKLNYNRFEERQIRYMLSNNKDVNYYKLYPNKEALVRDLLLYILGDSDFLRSNLWLFCTPKKYKEVTKQCEFIKCSRRLGISSDMFENYNNKVLNKYYQNKYMVLWSQQYANLIIYTTQFNTNVWWVCDYCYHVRYFIFLMLCFNLLFIQLERRRLNNISKFFGKANYKIDRCITKFARTDIF